MIRDLTLRNFKGWAEPPTIQLKPITGIFGANSSGKSSLIQSLLLFKQTVESLDRTRVLHLGDERSLVDLGTFYDLIHRHRVDSDFVFDISWTTALPVTISDPSRKRAEIISTQELGFGCTISQEGSDESIRLVVSDFEYQVADLAVGMYQSESDAYAYDLHTEGIKLRRRPGRPWPLPPPIKSYGFPDQVSNYFQNANFVFDLAFAFEQLMADISYVGPLRRIPERVYRWGGERPASVGPTGELTVEALLAARAEKRTIGRGQGRGRRYTAFEEVVAQWLERLGVIESFAVRAIGRNRKDYEVRVRKTRQASEVLITDVGFGVSQVLPVIVQLFYAPENSVVLLEQPELHLHPRVQSELADAIVEAVRERGIQVIVESHSEHFLRRLQLRVADETLSQDDVAIYFASFIGARSNLDRLDVDPVGNITNWPAEFFGNELGELTQMTIEAARRADA